MDLRGLRNGWDRPIFQVDLHSFLRQRFNFNTREFLKHIAPIFVTRRLARAHADEREANRELGIVLKGTRKKNDVEDADDRIEAKVTFLLLAVVDIDLSQRPDGEDWTKFSAKDGTPYDPTQSVECEVLRCFLKYGLPDEGLEQAEPARRKRKTVGDTEISTKCSPPKKRKKATPIGDVKKAASRIASQHDPKSRTVMFRRSGHSQRSSRLTQHVKILKALRGTTTTRTLLRLAVRQYSESQPGYWTFVQRSLTFVTKTTPQRR